MILPFLAVSLTLSVYLCIFMKLENEKLRKKTIIG